MGNKNKTADPVETVKASEKIVNPFEPGVTYEQFLIAKGDTPIAEYLAETALTQEQISWLEQEITHYTLHKQIK